MGPVEFNGKALIHISRIGILFPAFMLPACFDMLQHRTKISCQTSTSFPKAFFSSWLRLRNILWFLTILQSRPNSAKIVKYVNWVVSPSQTAPTAATSLGLGLPLDYIPTIWNKKIYMSTCTPVSNVHELSNAYDSVPMGKTEKLLLDTLIHCYLIFPRVGTALRHDLYHWYQ